ncbi:hypothetical protein AVEN_44342-1 [Araneus ventricosus]|uniref:Uncharacterized protein n=1 Tax=Araneus ventricosus TaxID=182803 RepID=A0A4Y2KJE0_ARAVE|nr:hypothetical protein AVEN_44342-1 [Araneus ventricosus]
MVRYGRVSYKGGGSKNWAFWKASRNFAAIFWAKAAICFSCVPQLWLQNEDFGGRIKRELLTTAQMRIYLPLVSQWGKKGKKYGEKDLLSPLGTKKQLQNNRNVATYDVDNT